MADLNELQASQAVKIAGADATGAETNFVNATSAGDLKAVDAANTSCLFTNVNVTNTAAELKVGGSRLTNRKLLIIEPLGSDIYIGYTSGVTTSNGMKITKGQIFGLPVGDTISVYAIASGGSQDTRIQELS